MPIQTEEQIMNFSKDQMFDLVADIDSYSQFLPWCDNSNIISTEASVLIMLELSHHGKNCEYESISATRSNI